MPLSPPPEIPTVSFPTPQVTDRLLVDEWNTEKGDYSVLQYGERHPNTREYPGYELVLQKPSRAEKWVQRYWVNTHANQDTYNANIHYSGDANAYPIYERTYWERRLGYAPRTKATALTGVVGVNVTGGGSGFTTSAAVTVSFSGGAGSGAAATAIVFRGTIVGVVVTAEGTGYTSAPSVAFTDATGTGATATAIIQPASAVLVQEDLARAPDDPRDSLWIRVKRVYETLPGPWIPFTRYDDNLGPIQGRRRAVLNTGQAASLAQLTKTTYEGRDGSAIVSWEIEETWAIANFPLGTDDFYDEERGKVQRTKVLVAATGSEEGSLVVTGHVATKTSYEAYNQFLLRKIVETWALPGPTRTKKGFDEETGTPITVTEQQVELAVVTTPTALSTSAAANYVFDSYILPLSDVHGTLVVKKFDSFPATRTEREPRGFQFPAVFEYITGWVVGAGPYPGVNYTLIPQRTASTPAEVTIEYFATQAAAETAINALTLWSIFSPGAASRLFPITANTVHNEIDLEQSGTQIELIAASEPSSYAGDEELVIGAGYKRWGKGNIHEMRTYTVIEPALPDPIP